MKKLLTATVLAAVLRALPAIAQTVKTPDANGKVARQRSDFCGTRWARCQ